MLLSRGEFVTGRNVKGRNVKGRNVKKRIAKDRIANGWSVMGQIAKAPVKLGVEHLEEYFIAKGLVRCVCGELSCERWSESWALKQINLCPRGCAGVCEGCVRGAVFEQPRK